MDLEIQQYILNAVDIVVQQRIKETTSVDITFGTVLKLYNDGTIDVLINNKKQTVYNMNNLNYNKNDAVIILILNNYSQKYVIGKKSAIII